MIHCPSCESGRSAVIDSRDRPAGRVRRRKCGGCGFRWNTVEVGESALNAMLDTAEKLNHIEAVIHEIKGSLDKAGVKVE